MVIYMRIKQFRNLKMVILLVKAHCILILLMKSS